MNFSSLLAALDGAVEDHLCDDAAYQAQGEGPFAKARVMINQPTELERMQSSGFTRARPTLSVAFSAVPGLRTGDTFKIGLWTNGVFIPGPDTWQVAAAPTRPDDGHWWRAEVQRL